MRTLALPLAFETHALSLFISIHGYSPALALQQPANPAQTRRQRWFVADFEFSQALFSIVVAEHFDG